MPLTLIDHSTDDLTTIRRKYKYGNNVKDLIVSSAYFPYDSISPPPTQELDRLVNHCRIFGLQFIIGADANAHNVGWGSTNNNSRDLTYCFEFQMCPMPALSTSPKVYINLAPGQ
ncbi:hypothetical protein WDU94_013320 [Cyamophila willieti]